MKTLTFEFGNSGQSVPGVIAFSQPNVVEKEISLYEGDVKVGFFRFFIYRQKGEKVIKVTKVEVRSSCRGKGYGRMLYEEFCSLWHSNEEMNGLKISRCFINPLAERLARRMVKEGRIPELTWDESFIERLRIR
jgi:predicted GNAT family acetyltransferase